LGFSLSFPHISLLFTSCESRLHKLALFIPLYFKFVLSPLASKWVFLWCYWGLNSVPYTCWAGTLSLEPHYRLRMGLSKAQSIFTPIPRSEAFALSSDDTAHGYLMAGSITFFCVDHAVI
jgi:hypothetical protein